ncbi:hypothetical protein CAPTEDRAFT_219618 [Capitella teleta]|uniref:Ubiquitin-like domain-containing protein n=1 Tax=Capitella teleta TaxID=283909 RepID=R7UX75_CAPTE|nr:hypothetical protein CAPTEDRAFT_219618 [Capitella teleta]|eukprot:ELU08006.1 hypothetical protein CAPTEDRAFT_219618 [Capitella teleta]
MDIIDTTPVNLVVKSPTQRIGDHIVQCNMEWTVEHLKEHLSDVYPGNPKASQQKIIYSGHLLTDGMKLKDILKQYHPDQTSHTIHLVCAGAHLDQQNSPSPTEGLRQRLPTRPPPTEPGSSSSSPPPEATPPPPPSSGAAEGFTMGEGGPVPVMMPGGDYSPQMMHMMQQLYAQQMAHYMQYYQHPAFQQQMQHYHGMTPQDHPAAVAPAAAAVHEPQAAAQRAAVNDQPIRMNAQGGAVIDDEDENVNRDWLDWVYTLSRFSVLLSIVYFYSSLSRFIMVSLVAFMIYMYQAGYLRLQRRVAPRQQQQPPEQRQPEQQQPHESENEGSASEEEADAVDEAARAPGPLMVAVSFVVNLFTSLVPQPPEVVNAN